MVVVSPPAHSGDKLRKRQSAWQSVVDGLERDVVYGRLQPREHLVEDALMQRFEVSRYAVRRAFEELQARGLAVRAENRGTYIRAYEVREVVELYEFREILEREAARMISLPGDPEWRKTLRDIQVEYDHFAAAADLIRITALNEVFHRTLFSACPNQLLRQQILQLALQVQPIRLRFFLDEGRRKRAMSDHWAMIEAIETADSDTLADICARHISESKAQYVRHTAHLSEHP